MHIKQMLPIKTPVEAGGAHLSPESPTISSGPARGSSSSSAGESLRNSCNDFARTPARLPASIMEGLSLSIPRRRSHHHPAVPHRLQPPPQAPPPLLPRPFIPEELVFLSMLERQYGTHHPFFYGCRFADALRAARREGKLVFVYLHDPGHPYTEPFCRRTLCSHLVVEFLAANFVSWGAVAGMGEGPAMVASLQPGSFPFCAVVASVSGRFLQEVEGPVSPSELVEILQRTIDEQGTAFRTSSRPNEQASAAVPRRLQPPPQAPPPLLPPPFVPEELVFLSMIEQQCGTHHPFFYGCRFTGALRAARREGKLVFVYLHDPGHPYTEPFCQRTLCSHLVVEFLAANFVSWGAVAGMGEGPAMVASLQPGSFPFCAVVASVSGRFLQEVEGPVSPSELVEILQRTIDEQGTAFRTSSRPNEQASAAVPRRLQPPPQAPPPLLPPPFVPEELVFFSMIEQQYGTHHPFFYGCRFVGALRAARREGKLVFVYLHDPGHPYTEPFCRRTLCSHLVVEFLDANFVSWGAVAGMGEGPAMVASLQPGSFPFCAVVASVSGRFLQEVEGPVSPSELVKILQHTIDEQGTTFRTSSRPDEHALAIRSARTAEEEERRSAQRLRQEQDAAYLYSSGQSILLVGDGDFSFSLALATAFGSGANLVATSLDTYEALRGKYSKAESNIMELKRLGVTVLHGVDAKKMMFHNDLKNSRFDRIVFNFPHAGFKGKEDDMHMINLHKELLWGFFYNARHLVRRYGEIHITHKTGHPYDTWDLELLASGSSLFMVEKVAFRKEDYPGYNQKRGDSARCDEPFDLGACCTFKFQIEDLMNRQRTGSIPSLGCSNILPPYIADQRPQPGFPPNSDGMVRAPYFHQQGSLHPMVTMPRPWLNALPNPDGINRQDSFHPMVSMPGPGPNSLPNQGDIHQQDSFHPMVSMPGPWLNALPPPGGVPPPVSRIPWPDLHAPQEQHWYQQRTVPDQLGIGVVMSHGPNASFTVQLDPFIF